MKPGQLLLNYRTIFILYVLAAVAVSIQMVSRGVTHAFIPDGQHYTFYNNYVIFKESFFNLINDRDLYILYPDKQWDLYKYSPAFALFMGLFAWLPDIVGLSLWNLLNALALFFAVRSLPLKEEKRSFILLFIIIELVTSLQNAQSNGLMAASLIYAYTLLRNRKVQWATLWLVIGTFIKIYGAIGFCLFLFFPQKGKFILYSALWTVVFALVPIAVTSPDILMSQYKSWVKMMGEDQSASYGLSVMGWLNSWFGLSNVKNVVTGLGVLLFFLPLLRVKTYKNELFRLLFLAHMLVWVVIFNHKAESPTFIMAVAGVAIWHFAQGKATWRTILLWVVFAGTCLTPTDVFPPDFRKEFLVPYVIKAVPAILLWCVIIYQLMTYKSEVTDTEYATA